MAALGESARQPAVACCRGLLPRHGQRLRLLQRAREAPVCSDAKADGDTAARGPMVRCQASTLEGAAWVRRSKSRGIRPWQRLGVAADTLPRWPASCRREQSVSFCGTGDNGSVEDECFGVTVDNPVAIANVQVSWLTSWQADHLYQVTFKARGVRVAAQQGVEADEAKHIGASQLNSSVRPTVREEHAEAAPA